MKPIFNALEFDGINSMQHSIFITGESVYDAPERDVESVEIAGRNGNVIIDNGRWKNIDVTYHAGTYGEDQAEFANKIRNFRNLLASRYGYHRLMDTYNPEEYRIGRFKSVEVQTEARKHAGEFDIVFDCKPQRFLTSGESAIKVLNGEALYNPTPYDASPLLAVQGYGTISFNGYEIEIMNEVMGDVIIQPSQSWSGVLNRTFDLDLSALNPTDTITLGSLNILQSLRATSPSGSQEQFTNGSVTDNTSYSASSYTRTGTAYAQVDTRIKEMSFSANTDYSQTVTVTLTATVGYQATHPMTQDISIRYIFDIAYTASTHKLSFTYSYAPDANARDYTRTAGTSISGWQITGYSTVSILGDPTYIDCDLGDAYMVKDGSYISLNRYIDLGSDLPVLAPGNNEVEIDNTITELSITSRWWIL